MGRCLIIRLFLIGVVAQKETVEQGYGNCQDHCADVFFEVDVKNHRCDEEIELAQHRVNTYYPFHCRMPDMSLVFHLGPQETNDHDRREKVHRALKQAIPDSRVSEVGHEVERSFGQGVVGEQEVPEEGVKYERKVQNLDVARGESGAGALKLQKLFEGCLKLAPLFAGLFRFCLLCALL